MAAEAYEVEITFHIIVEGSRLDAGQLRDNIDEAVYDLLNINCGEPECCPEPPVPGDPLVTCAVSSSTIGPVKEDE